MKTILIIFTLLFLMSCGKDTGYPTDTPYYCQTRDTIVNRCIVRKYEMYNEPYLMPSIVQACNWDYPDRGKVCYESQSADYNMNINPNQGE